MGGFGWAATTKTGPNDARRVVWALGVCFFEYKSFYFIYFHFITTKRRPVPSHPPRLQMRAGGEFFIT
jgi:hypothetical protein